MSRNIGSTKCKYCWSAVKVIEKPRPITAKDCGEHYISHYLGMLVAHAECPACLAQYIAWHSDGEVSDLSFRSSFNDEPGVNDLPRFVVEQRYVRVAIFSDEYHLKLGPVPNPGD